jgi:hypothetical protein
MDRKIGTTCPFIEIREDMACREGVQAPQCGTVRRMRLQMVKKKNLPNPSTKSLIGICCARSGESLIIHLVGRIVVVGKGLHDAEGGGRCAKGEKVRLSRNRPKM